MSHSLILLRRRVSKIGSDVRENKPNKKVSLISITFHSCFLSIIYARASYLANDLVTETSTYTYICLYQYAYLHRRTSNVQPSCFFFSSSSLLSTRATRKCAYASSGCDKKKITLYRNFFRNLHFKNIFLQGHVEIINHKTKKDVHI